MMDAPPSANPAPKIKRRVFLSYGHDEHRKLASKLRGDLERRGHEVWFDEDRLLPRMVWEERIEQGLDWVAAAGKDGCLVLLMTPYSVRRPDGFCLNEITRAVQLRIDVLPVMVVEVAPPLSICRIQWLDLKDCVPIEQHASRYDIKLEVLLRALEDHSLDYNGMQSRLIGMLKPLSYDTDIEVHLPRFTGRRWLLSKFEKWLSDPEGQKIFWISGPPGSGKSAIAAWLANTRAEIAAFHICVFDHKQKGDPSHVVRSLAWQLSTQLPGYFERLIAIPDLEELCADQGPDEGGSNARTLFDRLIVQPAHDLPAPGKTIALLIDALDEVTHNRRNELADFLASEAEKLPRWMRVMVTSRPESEVTTALQGLTPVKLEADSEDNIADVLAYVDQHLRTYATDSAPLSDAARQVILSRSEGNWLYLEMLRSDLQAKHLTFDELERFPESLGAAYRRLFERQFPNPDDYERTYRPLLDLIAATREPLKVDLAARILGWSPVAKKSIPLRFGALLQRADGVVRIYHRSVIEWLLDESRSGDYFASADQGHHELASWGWSEYERGVASMSEYARRHLPAHLARTDAEDRLVRCLTDVRFIRSAAQVGSVYDLAQYWRGRDVVRMCEMTRASFDELSRSAEPEAVRYEAAIATGQLLRHIGRYEQAMGYFDQALEIAGARTPSELGRAHLNAGWCLRHMERFAEAAVRLDRAFACFREGDDAAGMAHSMSAKGMCLWHTFDDLGALECFEQALPLLEKTMDQRGRAEVLNHIGIVQRSLGRFEEALRHLSQSEAIYRKLEDNQGLGKCLNSIGTAHWWSGNHDAALRYYALADDLNQRFNQPYVEGLTANNLGYLHLDRGELREALAAFERGRALREQIASKGYEMLDLSGIALAHFRLGDVQRARALSAQAIRELDRVETLEDLHRAHYNHYLIMKDGSAEDRREAEAALERARALAYRRIEPIKDAALRATIIAKVPLMKQLIEPAEAPAVAPPAPACAA